VSKQSSAHQQGGHLLQLPALRDASVVKDHPSIGAAALRTALVMAKKTVPWQLGGDSNSPTLFVEDSNIKKG
jgi:hypothetical protein